MLNQDFVIENGLTKEENRFRAGFRRGLLLLLTCFFLLWATVSGQDATFSPTIEVTLGGQPVGGSVEAGTNLVIVRVTTLSMADDLPGTRTLTSNLGTVNFGLLPVGTRILETEVSARATLLGATLVAGTATIGYVVTAQATNRVDVEGTIEGFTLNPLAENLLSESAKQTLEDLVGYLATLGNINSNGNAGFVFSETFNIPAGTSVDESVAAFNVSLVTTDTFVAEFYTAPASFGAAPLVADPQQGGTVSFSSEMTSLNAGLSVGPIISEFLIEDAESFFAYIPWFNLPLTDFFGIALSNATDTGTEVDLTVYGEDGTAAPFSSNPRNEVVAAGNQFVGLAREVFGIPSGQAPSGWIEVSSSSDAIGAFVQFGNNGIVRRLDGSSALTTQSQTLYLTRVFEGAGQFRGVDAVTTLSVANPNPIPVTVDLILLGPAQAPADEGPATASQELGRITIDIAARGALSGTITELFAETVSGGHVKVEVVQGEGVVASEQVNLVNNDTVFALNGVIPGEQTDLYSAQLASLPDVLFTTVKILNTSDADRTVTLTAVDNNGQNLEAPVDVVLGPSEFLEQDASELFGGTTPAAVGQQTGTLIGSLKVNVQEGGGVIGDVVFGLNNFNYAAASLFQTQTFKKAVFSHVANITGFFFTGLAVFNPGSQVATVTIEVFSPQGEPKGMWTNTFAPGERISDVLTNLVVASTGQAGGYIVITSDQPIVAQELFGTDGLTLLSSVPPKILE